MLCPLNEMYGYSRLYDRLLSSAIIWKHASLRSSAFRDRLRSFAIIWKPALKHQKCARVLKEGRMGTRSFIFVMLFSWPA